MIEEPVIQRVLSAALKTGGEFAEVFVEDDRSTMARLDDGKVEELTSGRERGAGIRVIVHKQDDVRHLHPLAVPVRRLSFVASAWSRRVWPRP